MPNNRYDRGKADTFHSFLLFIIIAVIAVLFFSFIIGIARVDGLSMSGTLSNGELLIMNRLQKHADRGEIVDVLLPTGEYYVKRVVGVSGDVIDLRDGIMYVNGSPESGYGFIGDTLPEDGPVVYPYTVPDGYLFVVGDNRPGSVDSRAFGAVRESGLKGVIKYRAGWLYIKKAE